MRNDVCCLAALCRVRDSNEDDDAPLTDDTRLVDIFRAADLHVWSAPVVLLVILCGYAVTPRVADAQVVVSTTPRGPSEPLNLLLATDQTSATASFYLRNDSSTALNGVILVAMIRGADDQQITGPTFTITVAGRTPAADGSITLPPLSVSNGTLRLENLPLDVALSGEIQSLQNGAIETLTALTIARHPRVVLLGPGQVAGSNTTSPGTITLVTTTDRPTFQLKLANVSPSTVTDLRVEHSAFVRKDGNPGEASDVSLSGGGTAQAPVVIDGHRLGDLTLTATVSQQTTYAGWVALNYDANRQDVYGLEITRNSAGTTFELADIVAVGLTRSPVSRSDAPVPVHIHDTSNLDARFQEPALAAPLKDASGQAIAANKRIEAIQGSPPIVDGKFDLPRRGSADYILHLQGLGPGSYSGLVAVSTVDGSLVSKPVTVTVKESAVIALIPIFVGVIGASFMYSWTKRGRPRALRAYNIARQREAIFAEPYSPPPLDKVWNALLRKLDELDDSNQFDRLTDTDATSKLAAIRTRQQNYHELLATDVQVQALLTQFPNALEHDAATLAGRWNPEVIRVAELLAADADPPADVLADTRKLYTSVRTDAFTMLIGFLRTELQQIDDAALRDRLATLNARLTELANMVGQQQFSVAGDALTKAWIDVIDIALDTTDSALKQIGDDLSQDLIKDAKLKRTIQDLVAKGQSEIRLARQQPQARADAVLMARHFQLGAQINELQAFAQQRFDAGAAPNESVTKHIADMTAAWRTSEQAATTSSPAMASADKAAFDAYKVAWSSYLRASAHDLSTKIAAFAGGLQQAPKPIGSAWTDDLVPKLETPLKALVKLQGDAAAIETDTSAEPDATVLEDQRTKFAQLRVAVLAVVAPWLKDWRSRFVPSPTDPGNWQHDFDAAFAELDIPDQANVTETTADAAEQVFQLVRKALDPPIVAAAAGLTQPVVGEVPRTRARIAPYVDNSPSLAGVVGAPGSAAPLPAKAYTRTIERNDWLVWGIFLLIATVSGLAALWLPSATWGAPLDYILALLWAFGISSTTGLAFNTIATNFGEPGGGQQP